MRSASRANTSSVVAPSIGAERLRPVRHSSHWPNDLHDGLRRPRSSRADGDLLDQRLDVGAQELRRAVADSCRRDGSAGDGGTPARTGSGPRRNPPCGRCRRRPSTAACGRRWRGRCRDPRVRTRSHRSSALRCPSWRRKMLRMRSRLLERLPPRDAGSRDREDRRELDRVMGQGSGMSAARSNRNSRRSPNYASPIRRVND